MIKRTTNITAATNKKTLPKTTIDKAKPWKAKFPDMSRELVATPARTIKTPITVRITAYFVDLFNCNTNSLSQRL
jgi:hypothetical protein